MSTIAVVSQSPIQPISISEGDLEGILKRPFTIGQGAAGILVSSQRDQIEVILGGNKINVRHLSESTEFSKSKIPDIIYFFMKQTKFDVNTYGVNFMITVPCAKPGKWIRDNILSPDISKNIGKTLLEGAAHLKIQSNNKVWNIKLEPTGTGIINVDFNASESTVELPDQSRLKEELQEQFSGLKQFLDDLGL